jgi:hypothetical protein
MREDDGLPMPLRHELPGVSCSLIDSLAASSTQCIEKCTIDLFVIMLKYAKAIIMPHCEIHYN